MDYFPHDTDAASDEKIEPLLMLYGAKGYALYFVLLERIYRQENFELDVSDAETVQLFCMKLQITEQEYHSIIATCLKRGAFDADAYNERQVLTSKGVKKRAEIVVQKRESMRNKVTAAETVQELGNNAAKTPQSKVKESKGKRVVKTFIPPTVDEVSAYCKERENGIDPQRFVDSNTSKGWVIGKSRTPMKDWKAAIRTWENNGFDNKPIEQTYGGHRF